LAPQMSPDDGEYVMKRRSGCARAAGWGALGCAVLVSVAAPAQQAAPARQECLGLHEKGQQQRKTSALLEARKTLRACTDEACPSLVREDCLELLSAVERAMPSVSFEVVVNGQDVTNAKISDSGKVLAQSLNGVPHELDPGVHKFKAEVSGTPPIESTEVIREGEKNRVIRLEYAPPPAPVMPAMAPEAKGRRPVPATAWVFGGLAIAAAGVGAAFGVEALVVRDRLACKPLCTDADLTHVRQLSQIADGSFGGALLFAAVGSYFFFTRPVVTDKEQPALAPAAFVGPTSGGLALRGVF